MNKKAFTMIELVVVMTLVAILMFIGYISYNSYLRGSRDSSRIADIQTIGNAIEISNAKGEEIMPTDYLKVSFGVGTYKYLNQGTIESDKLKKLGYSGKGFDPKTKENYSYSLLSNNKDYKIVAFLENNENLPSINEYSNLYTTTGGLVPYFYGTKKGGIVLDVEDVPVNINNIGDLEIGCVSNTFVGYKIFYKNGDYLPLDSTQSIYIGRPCYYDYTLAPACEKQPSYVNANFSEVTPLLKGNKIRKKVLTQDELDSEACTYMCQDGYKGPFCK